MFYKHQIIYLPLFLGESEEVPASNNKSNTTRGGRSYGVVVDNTASTSITPHKAVSHDESLMQMIASLQTEILELKKGRQEKDDQQLFVDKQREVFGKNIIIKKEAKQEKWLLLHHFLMIMMMSKH